MSSQFLCDLTNQVNSLTDLVNKLQQTSGLRTDTKVDGTIIGRLNSLESESTSNTSPTETTVSRIYVDKNIPIGPNGTFALTYTPINGVVVDDRVYIDNGEGTEDIYSGISFIGRNGTLVGAGTTYDGFTLTTTYLYAEAVTNFVYDYPTPVTTEFVHDLYQHMGNAYRVDVTITPYATPYTIKWEDSLNPTEFTEETFTTEHVRFIYESDFNVKLYLTGSALIKVNVRQTIG